MIEAVIFDMDGLLVDSEPYWRQAEAEIFGKLCVAPSEADFERMMGNRIQEVIRQWHAKHPWENFDEDHTVAQVVDEVARLVVANAGMMPGVKETIAFFREKGIPMALASSSPFRLIHRLMEQYGLVQEFALIHSAEKEPYGKPHPAVFLTTAELLKIDPLHCLVFEDSFNGVIAAKAARMKCVAVPAKEHFHQTRFDIAEVKLPSLLHFSEENWTALNK